MICVRFPLRRSLVRFVKAKVIFSEYEQCFQEKRAVHVCPYRKVEAESVTLDKKPLIWCQSAEESRAEGNQGSDYINTGWGLK